jgi:DNA (cytosine-5)-methyltransferase 1
LISALVTSLLKKITTPEQDIRLHRVDFEGGYSARTLDTKITAPFFKLNFPKYANKESSFLTLATRERIKWTLDEGQGMKIRNKAVKNSYLMIFDLVHKGLENPKFCLIYIFSKLINISKQNDFIYDEALNEVNLSEILNINTVVSLLQRHFNLSHGSRLPVIAIYSIYQELFKQIKRYDDKTLTVPNVHTSSDKHGFGDVEIWNADGTPFEMVEIKHNIPIDRNMIFDIVKKSQGTTIQRYYLLTTNVENFINFEEEQYINKFILQIKKDFNLEVIANGIIYSIKYYLRFIENYNQFILTYTKNLINDSKNSTEIKESHIEFWLNEIKAHNIENQTNFS